MAVDTRSRRAACLGIAFACNLTLPLVDGTVGQPDRQHVAYCYPGIQADTPSFAGIIEGGIPAFGIGATAIDAVSQGATGVPAFGIGATAVDAVAIRTS